MERNPRSVHVLVEQQVRRWQLEQQERLKETPSVEPPRPIVTISREAGARGTELGRLVAERLGFRLWDQELIQQIAVESGTSEALLRTVDERARSAIEDLLTGILIGDAFTEKEYLAQLMRVIHTIAQHGSAVVVGRGAHFILAPEGALRVRVVSLMDARARNLAAARGLPEREARLEVERIDRERIAFMRHHYKRDVTDPHAYDIIVNSAAIPPERLAGVVASAYQAKFKQV
jgi:cytidylate kinase